MPASKVIDAAELDYAVEREKVKRLFAGLLDVCKLTDSATDWGMVDCSFRRFIRRGDALIQQHLRFATRETYEKHELSELYEIMPIIEVQDKGVYALIREEVESIDFCKEPDSVSSEILKLFDEIAETQTEQAIREISQNPCETSADGRAGQTSG